MNSRSPTVARLLRLIRPLWRGMALSVALGALTVISSVGLMATSAWLISKAGLRPSIADLGVSVVMVRFFGITRGVFRYLERLIAHDTTFRLLAHIRVEFYRALEPLAPARLAQFRSGDLLSRVVTDVETLQNIFLRGIAPPFVALVVALFTTAFIAAFDPLAAVVALAFLAFAALALPALAWLAARGIGTSMITTRAELNAALVDGIQGMADALAYGYTHAQIEIQNCLTRETARLERQMARQDGLQTLLGVLLVNGAALAVLTVAMVRVEGVYLAMLALATTAAFEAITPLAQAAAHLGADIQAGRRLFEIVEAQPAVRDPVTPAALPADFALEFSSVTFRYSEGEPPALDSFSLAIPAGAKVAIVGPSGAGKSSLVNLLARFWESQSGAITLGGVDLRRYTQADVRRIFSVMAQRTHLFNTTICENIRLARSEASDDEVAAAAMGARIHDFILALPDGYDTYVGEDGAQLSGGERQRVALARVLLRDSPILILDEATANLDAVTERAILDTIFERAAGRTLIMLTHRLIGMERMDKIAVLHRGRVAEQGTHADLLAARGLYHRLFTSGWRG